MALDVCLVGFLSPASVGISLESFLNLSLPSASLAMGLTALGLGSWRERNPVSHRDEYIASTEVS